MTDKELIKEGKALEQELKALRKKLKTETKDLKKRYRTHMRNVEVFCGKHCDDTDLCLKVGEPFDRAETTLWYIPDVFEGWNHF
jgi:peptide subunit release factor 1 (eRF1)